MDGHGRVLPQIRGEGLAASEVCWEGTMANEFKIYCAVGWSLMKKKNGRFVGVRLGC